MSARKLPELIRRERALKKVVTKYQGRPIDFTDVDCIRMVRTLLVAMGNRPPKLPRYRSRAQAIRALKQAGFANVTELLDSLLVRIPPARMRPGDIAVMLDEDGIGAAVANVGNGKVFGWMEGGAPASAITAHRVECAWSTMPGARGG